MSHDPQFNATTRTPFHDPEGETVLRQIEEFWQTARGSRRVPARTDVITHLMGDAISHSFTLERVAPSVARFRVAGQNIHFHMNMDPRGMPMSAIFTPQGREMLAPLVFDACEEPALVEIPLVAQRRFAFGTLRARLLMMPMRNEANETDFILGALVLDGKRGARTLRFDFDPEGEVRIEKLRPAIRTVHEIVPEVLKKPVTLKRAMPAPEPEAVAPTPRLRLVVDNG